MAQYQFYTKKAIEAGVDFANIFPDKQAKIAVLKNVSYSLPDIVEFLKVQTNNFTKQDERFIDLDNAVRRIVSMSESAKTITETPKIPEAINRQPKAPVTVVVGKDVTQKPASITPMKPAEPTEGGAGEVVVAGEVSATKDELEATIETLREMLEDTPDDETLQMSLETVEEMLDDLNASKKFATGGAVSSTEEDAPFNISAYKTKLSFDNQNIDKGEDNIRSFAEAKQKAIALANKGYYKVLISSKTGYLWGADKNSFESYANGGAVGLDVKFARGGEFANVIGEKRAKEIVKYLLKEAKEKGVSLPKLQKFLDEGAKPGVLIEAYEEFHNAVNNGGNPKSLRMAYDDSIRFRTFVKSHFPDKTQREMMAYYGETPITTNFPGYEKGGTIGEKYKAGDFVFAPANHFDTRIKDESAKIPFFVLHWSHDKYYVTGDGSHYIAEDQLTPATEKDFNDYYGDNASEKFKHVLYAKGGGVQDKNTFRANNSKLLKYANFEDNSHINLLALNSVKTTGAQYKNANKYAVSEVAAYLASFGAGQKILKFKTLAQAEKKFDELVAKKKLTTGLVKEDKTANYKTGGAIKKGVKPKKYDNVEMLDRSKTDGFVVKIIGGKTALVSWFVDNEYDDKGMIKKEIRKEEKIPISKLAITRRP